VSEIVAVRLAGSDYTGWLRVEVERSLERAAHRFRVTMADMWTGDSDRWNIVPGQACQVLTKPQDGSAEWIPVLTGHIDDVEPDITPDQHTIVVSGRSKTADLVDCSATNTPSSWNDIDIYRLAADLCEPFGLTVLRPNDVGDTFRFTLDSGETPYAAIERACRRRGLLPTTNAAGDLALVAAGETRADDRLVYGQNVLRARGRFTWANRFSEYIVKGQRSGGGSPWSKATTQVFAKATDPGITRFRPRLIPPETQTTTAAAQRRASWEANIRAARSVQVLVTVQGWRQTTGALWQENSIVPVQIDTNGLQIDSDMLISSVQFTQGEDGTLCTIGLTRPDAFTPEPLKQVKNVSGGWPVS